MFFHPSFEVLRQVIQQGSFTKAAQKLDISSAAVGKHIQGLEHKLNMRLFHRTTRSITPTPAALDINDAVSQSLSYLQEVLEKLSDEQSTPAGRLKINVPMSYGEMFLAKPLAQYAARYPDVIVDVDFDDKRVHLIEEGYDLVIRIGILEDSGLIAKRISDFPIYLCASPRLIAKRGRPDRPEDLADWPMVCYSNAPHPAQWAFADEDGRSHTVSLSPALYANSASMMKQACLEGVGVALLPAFSCEDELAKGGLLRLWPDLKPVQERAVYAVYPDKKFMPLKVRKFIDILEQLR